MKVIAIGYDKKMFDRTSAEFDRMKRCAESVDTLDMIIFTRSREPFVTVPVSSQFTVHATASGSRILALFKALRLGWQIAKARGGVTVVTTQDPFETALVGWIIARTTKAHLNIQEHGDVFSTPHWRRESWLNQLRYQAGKWFLHRADTVRVVSKRSVATMRALLGPKKDIRLLSVAIALTPRTRTFSARTADQPFIFVTAARFVPQKNLTLLLNAFAAVHAKHSQVRLKIVGTGPQEIALKEFANQLFGVIDSPVTFTGWTSNIYAELTTADAYVLSSNYEGWARVLIEALAAGLPIVTTDVGCVGEIVINNEHALVVPVGDVDAFASALEKIVSDKDVYTTLQSNIAALDMKTIVGGNLETYATEWRESLM